MPLLSTSEGWVQQWQHDIVIALSGAKDALQVYEHLAPLLWEHLALGADQREGLLSFARVKIGERVWLAVRLKDSRLLAEVLLANEFAVFSLFPVFGGGDSWEWEVLGLTRAPRWAHPDFVSVQAGDTTQGGTAAPKAMPRPAPRAIPPGSRVPGDFEAEFLPFQVHYGGVVYLYEGGLKKKDIHGLRTPSRDFAKRGLMRSLPGVRFGRHSYPLIRAPDLQGHFTGITARVFTEGGWAPYLTTEEDEVLLAKCPVANGVSRTRPGRPITIF